MPPGSIVYDRVKARINKPFRANSLVDGRRFRDTFGNPDPNKEAKSWSCVVLERI
jgi:hypothetical protein